ncbi:DUF2069 domain-containing protein [Thalassotalea agarivorans]|uniref:Uncharacterized membrane protein n=1 Tax=Thalassotalea agarivorans TaxID=349064 RepID=A0A1I0FJL4_THASX|nr:DUF2069 domain-containing protein [Thalassotalea agarivorans]SET58229.1 Uncharacterized membrane protein [Thalassotalea agarivorans]
MAKQLFATDTLKKIALVAYFSLLIYMPLWLLFINPSEALSPALSLSLFWLPLLFPIRGLVKGNPYTYAWTNFIVVWFFLHCLTTLWVSPSDIIWASIELVFVTTLFLSATYYAKYKGQELGLSIRKKKDSTHD